MTATAGTRERILRAVLEVIADEGVGGVTNRRVARRAGVSLGSITYHFASQTDLLRASLLLFITEETERLTALAEGGRDASLSLEAAAALVEQVAVGQAVPIAPLELYLHAGRDPQLREVAGRCFAAYDAIAMRALTALGVADPRRLAGPVVALVTGLQLRRLATGTPGGTGVAEALRLLVRA